MAAAALRTYCDVTVHRVGHRIVIRCRNVSGVVRHGETVVHGIGCHFRLKKSLGQICHSPQILLENLCTDDVNFYDLNYFLQDSSGLTLR